MSAAPTMNKRYPKTVRSPSAGPVPQFISPHRRPTRFRNRTPGTARGLLAVVDSDQADEFKFFLAGGSNNFPFVGDLAVVEGLGEWRRWGGAAPLRRRFLRAHQRVFN